ncbi:MAG: exodeoxyribonuclease subunit gamma [Pseudomonadota bacterium]|jgi:exodeoxyribonuclease V gamma subunit
MFDRDGLAGSAPVGRRELTPGLLVLHGNRLELLQEAVFGWLARHPLDPLEQDVLLVQSNGIAEWMKMALARRGGVCAATRVELPARFLWRLYRAMLGREGAPARSPFDKAPLTWRLMQALPAWLGRPGFEPLAQFLDADPGDLARRLQLAGRLADLYDQYQIYRADWLDAWGRGREVLILGDGRERPLPDDQRWQARLWCALLDGLDDDGRRAVRSDVHRRFVTAAGSGAAPRQPLPRRVVLFGHSHLPWQTLEALTALAQRAQVLLAVPNPCRFHWADILDGRELLRAPHRRQPLRGGRDLADLPLDRMHAHAHPLLAAWGRQGRDFVRLLDRFDDAEMARARFEIPRIDLFDEELDAADDPVRGAPLLVRVQRAIRDGLPMAEIIGREQASPALPADDRSIVFTVAHSAMREVEILHDRLLDWLAAPPPGPDGRPGAPLAPRDIVVMVPDIEPWAPVIHAVFGQHGPNDPRRIPYEIADLKLRGRQPMLMALEWLLRITAQRCTASELRDLIDVPALAARFGLGEADRAIAARWLEGAGVRWGLDADQRGGLDLAACGEQNTGLFGLRRMLLGYAHGRADAAPADDGDDDASPWRRIDPYDEVGGLDAAIAGSLAALIDALRRWWRQAAEPVPPAAWHARALALLEAFLDPVDETDRLLLSSLTEALGRWLDDCEDAGFDQPVPLEVLREGWLPGVDEPSLNSRFLGGGVVFCTLMPMRAIPFEVVCLLGMNDGDYPRRAPRSDFDLLALPGAQRPGDRARRDDDRMLMLEALLAARRVLSVSWAGRSVRDNSEQPPSVLVAQLRDHLAAGWGPDVVARATAAHPLQPFSRRYFEAGGADADPAAPPRTWAREWRQAHAVETAGTPPPASDPPPARRAAADEPLTLARLERFLGHPVRHHFRERLDVEFLPLASPADDDEPLVLNALDETVLLRDLLEGAEPGRGAAPATLAACRDELMRRTARMVRRGELPVGGLGEHWRRRFVRQCAPVWREWLRAGERLAEPVRPLPIVHAGPQGLRIEDWLDALRRDPAASPHGPTVWLALEAGRMCREVKGRLVVQPARLVRAWLRLMLASACGHAVRARLVGRDAVLVLEPPGRDMAEAALDDLLAAWARHREVPLPAALRTSLAWLQGCADDRGDELARTAFEGGHAPGARPGEGRDPAMARLHPDWEALRDSPEGFVRWTEALYGPLHRWATDAAFVQVEPLPDAEAGDDEDGPGPGEGADD